MTLQQKVEALGLRLNRPERYSSRDPRYAVEAPVGKHFVGGAHELTGFYDAKDVLERLAEPGVLQLEDCDAECEWHSESSTIS